MGSRGGGPNAGDRVGSCLEKAARPVGGSGAAGRCRRRAPALGPVGHGRAQYRKCCLHIARTPAPATASNLAHRKRTTAPKGSLRVTACRQAVVSTKRNLVATSLDRFGCTGSNRGACLNPGSPYSLRTTT